MGATESVPADVEEQGRYEAVEGGRRDDEARGEGAEPWALVVCGPSGVGKGTLLRALMEAEPSRFGFSVSHTTRPPRAGEKDGDHYHFVSEEDFQEAVKAGAFLEHARVHGSLYGTSLASVAAVAASSRCCLLDIDVQGARAVRASGMRAIFVFIAPPSEEELIARIRGRATESEETLAIRVENGRRELESLDEPGLFDYMIVNDDLESAHEQFFAVAHMALAGEDPAAAGDEDAGAPPAPVPSKEAVAPAAAAPEEIRESKGEKEAKNRNEEEEKGGEGEPETPHVEGERAKGEVAHVSPPTLEKVWADVKGDSDHPRPGPPSPADRSSDWANKVAVVTGASSGIGRCIALELLQSDVRVVAVARRRERLEALQTEVAGLGIDPGNLLPVVLDVTKEAEVLALPKIIGRRWPGAGIDILVNNAAVRRGDAALVSGSTAAWVEMISTNVLAVSMCMREAVANMESRAAGGHIINIGQLRRGGDEDASDGFYHATKAAVAALTDALRVEVRERGVPVRVSLISPSAVNTEFGGAAAAGEHQQPSASRQKLDASDVAAAVLWCLAAPSHVDVSSIGLREAY
uniref:Guanylate kinase 1 n=1 Tax=Tetraselmis chuii TaxID=63592 RepID=A0A7S1SW85_9CHLO|mmetsp:Transcript_3164/g.5760  ORF Transcript_3164/g.5760 Transcript_3164/m.5760 type:complete len:579 (+) Transcript_3164:124-1860(+)